MGTDGRVESLDKFTVGLDTRPDHRLVLHPVVARVHARREWWERPRVPPAATHCAWRLAAGWLTGWLALGAATASWPGGPSSCPSCSPTPRTSTAGFTTAFSPVAVYIEYSCDTAVQNGPETRQHCTINSVNSQQCHSFFLLEANSGTWCASPGS